MSKDINENISNLLGFIHSSNNREIIYKNKELFEKIIGYSGYCFENEIKEFPDDFKKDLSMSFNILIDLYIYQFISKEFLNFVSNYVLLISNLNSNTLKDKYIQDHCNMIGNMYDGLFTSVQIFDFLKKIIKRYEFLTNYALPSVEISRHYLDSFKKDEKTE